MEEPEKPRAEGPGEEGATPRPPPPPWIARRPPRDRPLLGLTIVITRSEDRGAGLAHLLDERGARVISVPTIRFAAPVDPAPLEEAIRGIDRFRWVLFTSATGVHYFFEKSRRIGVPMAAFRPKRFGAVGPATASALASEGLRAERIAAAADAASLAWDLVGPRAPEPLGPADPCLLPQADIARPDLAEHLRKAGVPVTVVVAYSTVSEDPAKAGPFLKALEGDARIDGIAFASPSAMRSFLAMTHPYGEEAIREKPICVFSIGPTTTAAIRERGLQVAREAAPHTQEALVDAIVEELSPEPPPSLYPED
jgi:uroporphyrinogen-III synthase